MENKYRMTYGADIVFCIDTGAGMKPLIDRCPELIPEFCRNLVRYMNGIGRPLCQLRTRIIAYRDYLEKGKEAMKVTNFFNLPLEKEDFQAALATLKADSNGGSGDGLEALAYAIRSDWSRDTDRGYHVIVILSDMPTHPLGFGKRAAGYPKGMAKDFGELSAWWGSPEAPGFMDGRRKCILLFTPYNSGWKSIAENWDRVLLSSGRCCQELEFFDHFNIFAPDL